MFKSVVIQFGIIDNIKSLIILTLNHMFLSIQSQSNNALRQPNSNIRTCVIKSNTYRVTQDIYLYFTTDGVKKL